MYILAACAAGFVLDQIFGDPSWLFHPVRVIGKWIEILETAVRRPAGDHTGRLLAGGVLLWAGTVGMAVALPAALLTLAGRIHPYVRFVLEAFWCYQLLAARSLKTESRKVYQKLKEGDLPGARYAVSMIVGRDTENLTTEGVTKAAVETVAENTSDGVIAPLLFLLSFGAVGGFFYKAVNTLDSMVGYKNDRYLYFGRFAAKMDDVVNFIPARISALLMTAGAFILRLDGKNAWRIFCRDRYRHASPNSAQTESVCAGALDIQLAGDACYFGKLYHKETIGDPIRPVEAEDIILAGKLMDVTELLTLLLFGGLRLFLFK